MLVLLLLVLWLSHLVVRVGLPVVILLDCGHSIGCCSSWVCQGDKWGRVHLQRKGLKRPHIKCRLALLILLVARLLLSLVIALRLTDELMLLGPFLLGGVLVLVDEITHVESVRAGA